MRNKYNGRLRVLILFALLLCLGTNPVSNAKDAKLKRITGETDDGISVSVWVNRQVIKFGDDVIIYYTMENRSSKSIYLVLRWSKEMGHECDL